ncbi:hypothetical protein [Bacillus infantis]|uniref:Uncharacterized protein n=1 Tax=Bacillus infantis TaxID=324767 RepID=A0A5D4R5U8_9BACI|nr:hypothetical protein [Bacillus infantis]TYS46745.1 hypothetical protein FZD51_14835 [Bacillus infantis]
MNTDQIIANGTVDFDALKELTSDKFTDLIKGQLENETYKPVSAKENKYSVEFTIKDDDEVIGAFKYDKEYGYISTSWLGRIRLEQYVKALGGKVSWN